jgi:hypothetical protein
MWLKPQEEKMTTVRETKKALRLAAHREKLSPYRRRALRRAAEAKTFRDMRGVIEDSLIQGITWPILPEEIDHAIRNAI